MPCSGFCGCWGGRVLPLLLAYISYLLLGAAVFQLLEKQAEAQSRDQFQLEKLRFLENYTCLDQQALEQFVQVKSGGGKEDVGMEGKDLERWGRKMAPVAGTSG